MTTSKQTSQPGISRRAVTRGLVTSAVVAGAGLVFRPDHARAARPRFRAVTCPGTAPVSAGALVNPPNIVAATDGSYSLTIEERVGSIGGQQVTVQTYIDANNPNDKGNPGSPLNRPIVGPTITLTGNGSPVQNVTLHLTNLLPAGTYWYHPHKHGSVASQVANGMAGALIVKGDLDNIPGVAGLTEQVMVAQLVEFTRPTSAGQTTSVDPNFVYGLQTPPAQGLNAQITINGQVNPTVTMQFGEIQRWRFVNATYNQCFSLAVQPVGTTTAAPPVLYAIATDGVPLTNVPGVMSVPYQLSTPPQNPLTFADAVMNEVAVIAPAQRLDLLVQMPAVTGTLPVQTYALVAMPYPPQPCGTSAGQTIATITVNGSKATADTLPASTAFGPTALVRPGIKLPGSFGTTQVLDFSFTNGASINKIQFNDTAPQLTLKLNAVDMWRCVGHGALHAFHIHINSFVMYSRNGVNILPAVIWRDTARIDQSPDSGSQQYVEFVSQQLDYTGEFVLHCHVLDHEDFGMMWSVAITS